jgi:hopanoid biosynthesis associated radical SAM protein HpnH
MLEPLFRCNLKCGGCGKIAHSNDIIARQLSVQECLAAAMECGAPVISIAGGEPLLHPEIDQIIGQLVARKYFVYLCTNALLLEKRIDRFEPSAYLTFNIHLDGFRERHDELVCRSGVFDQAVAAIRLLISRGFRVTTNTTLFEGDTPQNVSRFFDFLTSLGVEGMTVAPAFNYEAASDQNHFLKRRDTRALFRKIFKIGKTKNWRFNHSSLYLDFLAGTREYECSPWGNPTRNIFGWQKPCYLQSDGYVNTYRELIENTEWEKYGHSRNPRCSTCMVHCGFEPSAVMDAAKHPLKLLKQNLL